MSAVAAYAEDCDTGKGNLYPVIRRTSAVSSEAESVRRAASDAEQSVERSVALFGSKGDSISEIYALLNESPDEGGDDDGWKPVSVRAAGFAADFIRALPSNVPLPEYASEPDGAISLDWIRSRHRIFSVSIGEEYRLPYAWLDGSDRGHAVAFFDGVTIPPRIIEGIRRVMSDGNAPVRTR